MSLAWKEDPIPCYCHPTSKTCWPHVIEVLLDKNIIPLTSQMLPLNAELLGNSKNNPILLAMFIRHISVYQPYFLPLSFVIKSEMCYNGKKVVGKM